MTAGRYRGYDPAVISVTVYIQDDLEAKRSH